MSDDRPLVRLPDEVVLTRDEVAIVLAALDVSEGRAATSDESLVRRDQLPTVKDVVGQIAINPNTVLKAYRELEHEGLAVGRPGVGTFVTGSGPTGSLVAHETLQADLTEWLAKGRRAGLNEDSIAAPIDSTIRSSAQEGLA